MNQIFLKFPSIKYSTVLTVFISIFLIGKLLATTKTIAHRGASAYAPENTLAAIQKAIDLNIKYIEIDIHMTKDKKIVALHDKTIDRTSNGKGNVFEYNYVELAKLDFGSWFSPKFQGEHIPLLTEILNLIPEDIFLIIEFKNGDRSYPDYEKIVLEIIKQTSKEKNVIIKSFDVSILKTFEKIAPTLPRLYCIFTGNPWFTIDFSLHFEDVFKRANFQYLQVHKYFLTKSLIKKSKNKNIKLVVWDVHDKKTMDKFKRLGVDLIESNNPDLLKD